MKRKIIRAHNWYVHANMHVMTSPSFLEPEESKRNHESYECPEPQLENGIRERPPQIVGIRHVPLCAPVPVICDLCATVTERHQIQNRFGKNLSDDSICVTASEITIPLATRSTVVEEEEVRSWVSWYETALKHLHQQLSSMGNASDNLAKSLNSKKLVAWTRQRTGNTYTTDIERT